MPWSLYAVLGWAGFYTSQLAQVFICGDYRAEPCNGPIAITLHLSYSSEAVMRLGYQILMKSAGLKLVAGSAPVHQTFFLFVNQLWSNPYACKKFTIDLKHSSIIDWQ